MTETQLLTISLGYATVAVWDRFNDGMTTMIQATNGTIGPMSVSNASGKQVKNRFPAESEYFNQLKWTASSSPNVVAYNIYRNGELIATVSGQKTKYRDHNRTKGVLYVYTIKAVDDTGSESPPITVTVQ